MVPAIIAAITIASVQSCNEMSVVYISSKMLRVLLILLFRILHFINSHFCPNPKMHTGETLATTMASIFGHQVLWESGMPCVLVLACTCNHCTIDMLLTAWPHEVVQPHTTTNSPMECVVGFRSIIWSDFFLNPLKIILLFDPKFWILALKSACKFWGSIFVQNKIIWPGNLACLTSLAQTQTSKQSLIIGLLGKGYNRDSLVKNSNWLYLIVMFHVLSAIFN